MEEETTRNLSPDGLTADQASKEFNHALDLLARYLTVRDHSHFELESKLSRKYGEEMVVRVLAAADERGWLLDENAIAERATEAWRDRLKSALYIETQLRKRRLPVPEATAEAELATARKLLIKKFGDPGELDLETKDAAFRFMSYRGFEENIIRKVLDGREE
jgi:SOS response regulatory protein OraA/RecX